jgi:hypothetical protein
MTTATLQWLRDNEHPQGGIRAWPGAAAYPEVSGYLLPTLYDYGEGDLATRCADWLVSIQDTCGGWRGMDGELYTFDTGAIVEGMFRAYHETGRAQYQAAALGGCAWLATQRTEQRTYRTREGLGAPQHNYRVNGILQDDPGAYHINGSDRVHFIAYALEGYLSLGYVDEVRGTLAALPARPDGLMFNRLTNWRGEGSDVIATAQIAILKLCTGLDAAAQIAAVRQSIHPGGGVPQSLEVPTEMSWGAKFTLDMEREATK